MRLVVRIIGGNYEKAFCGLPGVVQGRCVCAAVRPELQRDDDSWDLARGIMAVYGRCRPVPRKARGVLNGLMFVVYAGTWIWLGFRSLTGAAALSGAVWTAALFFTALAVIWVVMKVKDRH